MNGITVTLDTTPQHADELTRAAVAGEGFGILTEIDVAATFAAKLAVHRPALKILGARDPMSPHTAIRVYGGVWAHHMQPISVSTRRPKFLLAYSNRCAHQRASPQVFLWGS